MSHLSPSRLTRAQTIFVAIAALLLLLTHAPAAAEEREDALFAAAGKGDVAAVRALLADGVDANAWVHGWTPLHLAKTAEVAEELIKRGADLNFREWEYDFSPLYCAVTSDRVEVATVLLAHGASIGETIWYRPFPLYAARSVAMVRLLIANKAGVDSREPTDRTTPLCTATTDQAAAALIEAGADVRAADRAGRTPLHRAAEAGWVQVTRWLVQKGADVNAKDVLGRTPLHYTTSAEEAAALIAGGARADIGDHLGRRPNPQHPTGLAEEHVLKGMTMDQVIAVMRGRPSWRMVEQRLEHMDTSYAQWVPVNSGTGHEEWWYRVGGRWSIHFDDGTVTKVEARPNEPTDPFKARAIRLPPNLPAYYHDPLGR